jgi:hypothetical protein
LKALDPNRPIREADIKSASLDCPLSAMKRHWHLTAVFYIEALNPSWSRRQFMEIDGAQKVAADWCDAWNRRDLMGLWSTTLTT